MIKNVLLFAICCLAVSCTSKQQKAENLVTGYLHTHLKNADSYKSVSFSGLDTTFKRYTNSKPGDSLLKADKAARQKVELIRDTLMKLVSTSEMDYKEALKRQLRYEADTANLSKTLRERELLFSGPVNGWTISHTYLAKNNKGALVTHISQFRLDSALTKVVNVDEIK